jgi:hypothetical protein
LGRLFITPREIDLVNDLTKELIKDVVGQKIYYYSISLTKTKINTLYDEAPEKIFENPVEINCFVNYKEPSYNIGKFGVDETQNIEAYIQYRDLIDKGIEIDVGDFFSYGDVFFEITSATKIKELFGQIEYGDGFRLIGKQARKEQFVTHVIGPTDEKYSDADAIQETFVQQRGFESNEEGKTGDVRELQKREVLERPISGPQEVSPKGSTSGESSSFYDDE